MKRYILSIIVTSIILMWTIPAAQAGMIRGAGKTMRKGSITVVQKTSNVAGSAGSGAGNATKATAGALKTGTVAFGKGVVATPKAIARGTKAAPGKLWKIIW